MILQLRELYSSCSINCRRIFGIWLGMHVLVITDMTNYAEALREISAAREEVQDEKDILVIFTWPFNTLWKSRKTKRQKRKCYTSTNFVNAIWWYYSPNSRLTGYITEGQIQFGRDFSDKGFIHQSTFWWV